MGRWSCMVVMSVRPTCISFFHHLGIPSHFEHTMEKHVPKAGIILFRQTSQPILSCEKGTTYFLLIQLSFLVAVPSIHVKFYSPSYILFFIFYLEIIINIF